MVERVREREVASRIRVTDAEIDALIEKRRGAAGAERADQHRADPGHGARRRRPRRSSPSGARAPRRRCARVRGGEDFAAVAREVSEDSNRAQGGEIGMRPADRLPDVFVAARSQPLKPGEVAPELLRSGAGFHVLKLRRAQGGGGLHASTQIARAPHPAAALARADRRGGGAPAGRSSSARSSPAARTFEQLARENSEDGSAPQGGDLGWAVARHRSCPSSRRR